jgi:hypothetical protein
MVDLVGLAAYGIVDNIACSSPGRWLGPPPMARFQSALQQGHQNTYFRIDRRIRELQQGFQRQNRCQRSVT